MTNILVGEVYAKIIEEVVNLSTTDFEETGVGQATLQALQQEWQVKLSQRTVAQMPWDPKPVQQSPAPSNTVPSNNSNGLPSSSYTSYDAPQSNGTTNGNRIKTESGTDQQFNGLPNGYPQNGAQPQGGIARAQQLVQQQYGQAANASLNAMQRGGLALPGQPQSKPQGLQLPQQSPQQVQQQFAAHQQQMQQQAQPNIKIETDSPQLNQGAFQPSAPNYGQTDGSDDAFEQWQNMLAERRALGDGQRLQADNMMRDLVMQSSLGLQSGLMVPLDEQPSLKTRKRKAKTGKSSQTASSSTVPTIPQLDGEDDDDERQDIKDEDDENAINSDLDDTDDDGKGPMGEDDDEYGDEILCTYDKVQRVKNKWKCTLKDGVMSAGGKDWVFHKGMGEFEW